MGELLKSSGDIARFERPAGHCGEDQVGARPGGCGEPVATLGLTVSAQGCGELSRNRELCCAPGGFGCRFHESGRAVSFDVVADEALQAAADGDGLLVKVEVVPSQGEGFTSTQAEGEQDQPQGSLLSWAAEQATDLRVVRSVAVEPELELPYGALGYLLRPLYSAVARLDVAHAGALRAVFAAGGVAGETRPSFQPDRFAVGAAALALLAASAEEGPLLVVMDDAHWLDHSSAEALAFMARRLLAEGIVLLLSRRTGEGNTALTTLPTIVLTGLEPAAATALLMSSGGPRLSTERVKQLIKESNGNPLALAELPRLVAADELAGLVPAHKPLPIGERLTDAFARSFSQLPDKCRQAAAIVAMLSRPGLQLAERALHAGDLSVGELAAAEDAGLIELTSAGVSFRHPLARSAAAYSVPATWRRRAHNAVAQALADAVDINQRIERAWHLAAASTGASEETAAMLEDAAADAAAESGWGIAVPAYERAADLSPGEADRYRRLVLAGQAAYHAGFTSKARSHLDSARQMTPSDTATAVTAAQVTLRVALGQARFDDALAVASAAADDFGTTRPVEAATLLGEAATAAAYQADVLTAQRYVDRGMELLEQAAVANEMVPLSVGGVLGVQGEYVRARELSSDVVKIVRLLASDQREQTAELLLGDPYRLQIGGWAAWQLFMFDELDLAELLCAEIIRRAPATGALTVMSYALTIRASIAMRRGDWTVGRASTHTGIRTRPRNGPATRNHQRRHDRRLDRSTGGKRSRLPEAADFGLRHASNLGMKFNEALIELALGILELSRSNSATAIAHLDACRDICETGKLLDFGYWHWAPELVEAYVREGNPTAAADIVDNLEGQATNTGRPILHAFAARCRGLLADDYVVHFERALGWHEQSDRPFELARTRLCYGERLRRDKKRAPARRQLEQARTTFQRLGSTAWAERAATELEATGVSTRETPNGNSGMLTPQELQVALAVADGATNREAAAQLFLSPKTIGYHLSRVFRKLDVTSRTALAASLAVDN